jgi:hypothetical protein
VTRNRGLERSTYPAVTLTRRKGAALRKAPPSSFRCTVTVGGAQVGGRVFCGAGRVLRCRAEAGARTAAPLSSWKTRTIRRASWCAPTAAVWSLRGSLPPPSATRATSEVSVPGFFRALGTD